MSEKDPETAAYRVETGVTEGTVDRTRGPACSPAGPEELHQIEERVVQVLKTCYDPEIPVDIYDLGLVYGIEVSPERDVVVTMTLTSPMCPVAESLPPEVEDKVRNVADVRSARVSLVWEPTWDKDMMSEAAKLQLGFL